MKMNKLVISIAVATGAGCGNVDAQLAPAYAHSKSCAASRFPDEPAMYGDPSFWLNGGLFFDPEPVRIACADWRSR